MDIAVFEFCMDDLASAIHADLLLLQVGGSALRPLESTPRYLDIAIQVVNSYRATPIGLDEIEEVEGAMRDAERRIWFGVGRGHHNPLHRHLYLREQLSYAFTESETRKQLFAHDLLRAGALYTILEEE